MNLAAVMDEIAAQIRTMEPRTLAYPPDVIQPPTIIVSYPETYTYDETFGRGMDRLTIPVVVLVGKVSDRASRDQLAAYVDGSGPKSIKAVVEDDDAPYTAFDSVRVTGVEFDVVSVAGVPHMAGTLSLDVAGGN